jgi:hypothetical protein
LCNTGIFAYIEEKGMEMDISVKQSRYQAAFMLAALRELREDSRELKKKRKETETAEQGEVLGPLLGPAIKADKGPASPPPGFEPPENLESVGLEMDLPVGFRRLRWAMLNSESRFMKDAVFAAEAKYEEYVPLIPDSFCLSKSARFLTVFLCMHAQHHDGRMVRTRQADWSSCTPKGYETGRLCRLRKGNEVRRCAMSA